MDVLITDYSPDTLECLSCSGRFGKVFKFIDVYPGTQDTIEICSACLKEYFRSIKEVNYDRGS